MKLRKAVVISILMALGIACAGAVMAVYRDYSVKASAPSLPDALNNIPLDYQFVFGINVQKFVRSSAYAQFQRNRQIGNDLAAFIEKTGIDPERDISYLVGAGRAKEGARNEGVMIVVGRFDKDAISDYIRSQTDPIELEYGGAAVLMIPDAKSGSVERGIAFLNEREIAVGDLEALKAVLDVRGGERSILSSESMAPLINSIGSDEMFWFAGDAAGVLARAPATSPLAKSASLIKNVVGTLNVAELVTGKITATASSADSAVKLADAVRGLIALGQLSGNQHAELKELLGGLVVSQDSTQVSVALNFRADLLDKLGHPRRF